MIAVADTGNDRVQVFNATSAALVLKIGAPGSGDGQLNAPQGVAYSAAGGRIAVADTGNDRVQVFSAGGVHIRSIGAPGAGDGQLNAPQAVAYSPNGSLLAVADTGNDRVQVFNATNGSLVFKLGYHGAGAGTFNRPASAAFAGLWNVPGEPEPEPPEDRLLPGAIAVSERGAHRVQVFHPNGTHDFTFGQQGTGNGSFNRPMGVSLAPDGGAIAVADMYNDRVQVFGPDGMFNFAFGFRGDGNGSFKYPAGVAYSPDGARLAVADYDNNRVQVFRAADGAHILTSGGPNPGTGSGEFNTPRSVSYSPDGGTIAVADAFNGRIKLINATTGTYIDQLGGLAMARAVAYSPDGGTIAAVDRGHNRIQAFYTENRTVIGPYYPFGWQGSGNRQFDNPTGIAYSANGSLLAVADMDNDRVTTYRAADGHRAWEFGANGSLAGNFNKPTSVAFVTPPLPPLPPPPPTLAGTDTGFQRIIVFDAVTGDYVLKSGVSIYDRVDQRITNGSFGNPAGIAYSPTDGSRLAVTDVDLSRVQVFDAATGDYLFKFGQYGSGNGSFNHPADIEYSPIDGSRLAVADAYNHRVQVFDAATGDYLFKFGRYGNIANGSFNYLAAIAYSPDGSRLAVASRGTGPVQVFDAATGDYLFKFGRYGHTYSDGVIGVVNGSFTEPAAIAYSLNGSHLAVADAYTDHVQVIDAVTGNYVFGFGRWGSDDGEFHRPTSVAYSPDGSQLAVADEGDSSRIQVFDAATGDHMFTFPHSQHGYLDDIAYSPLQ